MHAIYQILLITVFLTLAGCGGGGSNSTSTVDTYRFTGTVNGVQFTPPSGITVGTAVTGTFSVDRNSIGNTYSGTPNITTYTQTSLAAVNIRIGGMTFNSATSSYVVTIGDNVNGRGFGGQFDQFSWTAVDPTLAAANSLISVSAGLNLADYTGLSFDNTALPTTLAQFDTGTLFIRGTGNAVNWEVMSTIDSITKIN